jgi:chromosome segregation ATPase
MHGQRRLDATLKRERVIAALDACLASGREITITGVARHAGVSRKFIYSHPDLRADLELRALRATHATAATGQVSARVTGASLRADAENHKAQNHRLRQQLKALEQRLSETLGNQIATTLPHDERISLGDHNALRERLERSEASAFELAEALAAAREELDAAREINRELLSQQNRATG